MTTMPPDDGPPDAPQAQRRQRGTSELLELLVAEIQGLRADMRIARRQARGPVPMSDAEMASPLAKKKTTEPMQYPPKSMPALKGKKLGELDPETLEKFARVQDELADFYDNRGDVDPKGPKSRWCEFEASLARGIARRKRATPPVVPVAPSTPSARAEAPAQPPPSASDAWEPPDDAVPPADSAEDDGDDVLRRCRSCGRRAEARTMGFACRRCEPEERSIRSQMAEEAWVDRMSAPDHDTEDAYGDPW